MQNALSNLTQALSASKYKQKFNSAQRIEYHELLKQTHLVEKKLNPNDYCFLIIEPTNKFLQEFEGKGKKIPQYKMQRTLVKYRLKFPRRQDVKVLLVMQVINQHYGMSKAETLFVFSLNGSLLSNQASISDIYNKYKDPQDDFIYMKFSNTQTF